MAKKNKNKNKSEAPPPPTTPKAPSIHSIEPPTATEAEHPASLHHHHDHEHHHHHSHYARSVDSNGNVKETLEVQNVDQVPTAKDDGVKEQPAIQPEPEPEPKPEPEEEGKEEEEEPVLVTVTTTTKTVKTQQRESPSPPPGPEPPAPFIKAPSKAPSVAPTKPPSVAPSKAPSAAPSQKAKSKAPSVAPTPAVQTIPLVAAPAFYAVVPTIPVPTPIPPPAASIKAPSAKAPSEKPPSVKPPSAKAPTTKAPSVAPPPPIPSSPASSHRSHRSHSHHPEVIVNVNVPPAAYAPPAPPAVADPPPQAPAPAPSRVPTVRAASVRAPSVAGTPLVVATELPVGRSHSIRASPAPSPAASTKSKLSNLLKGKSKSPTTPDIQEDGEIVEQVTTTTTTYKKRAASPPTVHETGSPFVENVAEAVEEPENPPAPTVKSKGTAKSTKAPSLASQQSIASPAASMKFKLPHLGRGVDTQPQSGEGEPMRTIETTTVETYTFPLKVPDGGVEVDTAATTVGGRTTKGITGARSAALSATSGRLSGTKGGIRPIPIIDYQSLIRRTPPPKEKKLISLSSSTSQTPPTSTRAPTMTITPTATGSGTATGPKTIATMSAHLDRDAMSNEHLHATLRDHTGVKKTHHDQKDAEKGLQLDIGEPGNIETEKERKKREKKEKKELEKEKAKGESKPYRPIGGGALPPPKSEKYAYPPAPTVIEQQARERYNNRVNQGQSHASGGNAMGMGMGGMGMGMGMGPPYPPPYPITFPRPPPLVAHRPPMFGPPPMMNPMMGMGMGMGMGGMPMMGMGMPMGMPMPMAQPIPGVVPGMPGMGFYNSMPGRFGRDMLGRDFAGPGGVGSSQPYRPPDPSALPPMPFGLPFIARPGQEGFDQYGRMLPPDLPEGWDGWGRPIVAAGTQPSAQQQAQGGPTIAPDAQPLPKQGMGMGKAQTQTRDMPFSATMSQSQTPMTSTGSRSSTGGTGRPDQPACFDRPPAKSDSYYRYDPFEAFSFPASSLNRAHQLHLPPELVSRDVNEDDWMKFIDDLSREALHGAKHDFLRQMNGRGPGGGPNPILSDSVHSLLASWAVAFFAPRGIRVYAAQDGKRVIPPPVEPPSRRGYTQTSEWSDSDDASSTFDEDTEEEEARKMDMYLPKREREIRKNERKRMKRKERRRWIRENEVRKSERKGDWEIHFVQGTPTIWQKGARPRTYGEPAVRLRR